MNSSTAAPVANRWYDRVFRFCLYGYWVLAAWYIGFISQLMILMETLKRESENGQMLKLFTFGDSSFSIGTKVLTVEWGFVVMAFMSMLMLLMIAVAGILSYKGLRWLCSGRVPVQIINFKSPVFLWAVLLTPLFWCACWFAYSFSDGAKGRIEFEVYILMTAYSALLVLAGLFGGLLPRCQPRFVRMGICVVVTLLMAYFLPFRGAWAEGVESAETSAVENKTASE